MTSIDVVNKYRPTTAPAKQAPKATNGSTKGGRNGKGQFVARNGAVASQPKAEVAPVVPTAGFSLFLESLGNGGKDGTGSRLKGEVRSTEESGHRIRVLIYTDNASEMDEILGNLGVAS